MTFQTSVAVGNAQLDAFETQIGTSAVVKIFTGAEPANCAAADPAGLLVTITLPADWMNAASGRSKTLLGTWSATASATGTAASFRLYASDGTTCGAQGSVTFTGSGGDMTIDAMGAAITSGNTVTVTGFTLNGGNS
jgi:hypothetical protein